MFVSRRAGLLASTVLLAALATEAQAQKQIISSINAEELNHVDTNILSNTAGKLISYNDGSSVGRVLTDFGVNKVFASAGTDGREQTNSSAWLDSYLATGAAGSKVKLSFTFTIDGSANFAAIDDDVPEYNFKVFAMRGGGWTVNGQDSEAPGGQNVPLRTGSDYGEMFLQRVNPQGVEQLNMDEDAAYMSNYFNVNGEAGGFRSQVSYDEGENFYRIVNKNPQGFLVGSYFYKDFFRSGSPDQPLSQPISYNNNPGLRNTRLNLEGNFSILDSAALCDNEGGGCGSRLWEPTPLTVEFEVLAGQSFTLAAWMFADDVENGTVDFFNTAKLSGVTAVSDMGGEVMLTSSSGTLVAKPGGGFGYIAAGVPEPASWAMMIGGFGLAGFAARKRRASLVTYA
jgi:hypothetical protein